MRSSVTGSTPGTPDAALAAAPVAQAIPLRDPAMVMRLARMGSFHQTRLSFMRVLLRRLQREEWQFDRPVWRVDERGEGVAVYRARGNGRTYDLVAFPHDLNPQKRSDRVIADAWDATFVLHEGAVDEADIVRLAANVPLQEAGRCSAREIVLSRANKSVRLFDSVVAQLAAGRQPEKALLDTVGYLMRTTAVYANGKFGLSDRERIASRPEFAGPFSAEMLTVWLIRAFTIDLVEHAARVRAPATAVPLDRALRRGLGVGNATGLGMAPFLFHHPALIDRWMTARETALARVRSLVEAAPDRVERFLYLLARARRHTAGWRVDDVIQSVRIDGLEADLAILDRHCLTFAFGGFRPWDAIYRWAEASLRAEAQELLVTLLIDPYGDRVDDLAETMACDEEASFVIDGAMPISELAAILRQRYGFAFDVDFADSSAQALFWYVSEEKLEPRLGHRDSEPGAEREQPLTAARDAVALASAIGERPGTDSVAALLLQAPELRHIFRRAQTAAARPYAEIADNLVDASVRPIDLLRCKLSFFGATRFDPKSDRWVRITLFQNAPFPDEMSGVPVDDWAIPPIEREAPCTCP